MTTTHETEALAGRNAIELAVASVEPGCSDEIVAEARTKVKAIKQWASDMLDQLDSRIADVITASGKDIRYRIGEHGEEIIVTTKAEKIVKCTDVRAALEELLTAFDGDFNELAQCLASGAWKPGAVGKALEAHGKPALFDALFETSYQTKIVEKTGKPKVREINTAFIK